MGLKKLTIWKNPTSSLLWVIKALKLLKTTKNLSNGLNLSSGLKYRHFLFSVSNRVANFGYVQEVSAPWNPCCWGAENGFYKTKESIKYICRVGVLLHFSHQWWMWNLEENFNRKLEKTTLLFWWWAPEKDRNKWNTFQH